VHRMIGGRGAAALLVWVVCVFSVGLATAQDQWEVIEREGGVTVSQRWPEGNELPIIKGVGTIDANIYEILAVMADIDRMCEWMYSCVEARLLNQSGEFDRTTYNRFDLPWPLDDRDAVLQSKITIDQDKKFILVKYWDIQSKKVGPIDGIVRVPQMKGFYKLEQLAPDKTRVTYQGEAKPGGLVPDWVVAQSSKNIPLKSILKLREQVAAMNGKYPAFMKSWDPRQGGMGF
jgi:hypothetical protein